MRSDTEYLAPVDIAAFHARGKSSLDIALEVEMLRRTPPAVFLRRPCDRNDGVIHLTQDQETDFATNYQRKVPSLKVVKFVAASGCATRMFQDFSEAVHCGTIEPEVLTSLPRWAFFNDLERGMAAMGQSAAALLAAGRWREVFEFLLEPDGLGYLSLPKALIPYHRYSDGTRTALEEHLLEASGYARGSV